MANAPAFAPIIPLRLRANSCNSWQKKHPPSPAAPPQTNPTRYSLPATRYSDGGSAAAFTLIEIILVVALIGLLSSVLVVGANALLKASSSENPEQIFWNTVAQARRTALQKQFNLYLSFDTDNRTFQLHTPDPASDHTSTALPAPITAQFLPSTSDETNTILIAGQSVEVGNTTHTVTFYDDGTCSPFRIQFLSDHQPLKTLEIDPWTCAQLLLKPTTP